MENWTGMMQKAAASPAFYLQFLHFSAKLQKLSLCIYKSSFIFSKSDKK
jgi:hypothetical protein